MRSRGAAASRAASEAISARLARHADEVTHPAPGLAADFAYRVLFALATQTVMFDDDEVTSVHHSHQAWVDETTELLVEYLGGARERSSPAT